ncbi:MAG: DUF4262 domain-containing protein [Phenylobacterium sp.]|uniref:DUF4262 domain-containing protein n=1 Tax=Phenylobacterium sp. TaxID=1871053 RepID=UPI0025EEDCF1|nr:DUF4262 domain-containing protein [Phenylobacterium sp.]MBI1199390.1 DUF4262 domain-containing protein [Phenylobacterium sp.]
MFRQLGMWRTQRALRKNIETNGWTIVPVEGPDFGWAYTVGLWERFGLPELITFTLSGDDAARLIAEAQACIATTNLSLEDGLLWNDLGFECCWRRVSESQYLGFQWFYFTKWYYESRASRREPVECFQLFSPDNAGRFPWEDGCSEGVRRCQPQLFRPFDPDLPGGGALEVADGV